MGSTSGTHKDSTAKTHPRAGQPCEAGDLIDVPRLVESYWKRRPDPAQPSQRVHFGTSGHRGSSLSASFNEAHILAISQAICLYRREHKIDGPLFLGIDTHGLSEPAMESAVEVLAANEVDLMIAEKGVWTPTPAVSRAILAHNRGRSAGLADGIVVTPSHNPPKDGGFKYNPAHGGPAEEEVTRWIEGKANEFLESGLKGVKRMPFQRALLAPTTHRCDYMTPYVEGLGRALDMETIARSGLHLGVDPLGGAGVRYWPRIAERYGLKLDVVNDVVDPTFRFMTLDWDGQIRMDPSSPDAMRRLIGLKDRFDIAFACDTDHDRHGIVARSKGLLPPNHYLAVAVDYLFRNRPAWRPEAAVGKTLVSSQMIDRVVRRLGRKLYETPVGFKWFVSGLLDGSLGFGGEESAGASFLDREGVAWSTDKDGIIAALLSAEITAKLGKDPGEIYRNLANELGDPVYARVDREATTEQRDRLLHLTPEQFRATTLAGERILGAFTRAPGNGAGVGGLKVVAENGWFAIRPSGTENVYKLYAESFLGAVHLRRIQDEARDALGL